MWDEFLVGVYRCPIKSNSRGRRAVGIVIPSDVRVTKMFIGLIISGQRAVAVKRYGISINHGWLSSVLRPRQHSIGYMGDGYKPRYKLCGVPHTHRTTCSDGQNAHWINWGDGLKWLKSTGTEDGSDVSLSDTETA